MKNLVIVVILSMFAATATFAEVVKVPVGQQAADQKTVPSPHRGSSKTQVKTSLGEPGSIRGPVGKPPISAWEYERYVVYFEHDKVLHSVYKRH